MKRYWIPTAVVIAMLCTYVLVSHAAPASKQPWPDDEPAWEYKVLMRQEVFEEYGKVNSRDEFKGRSAALTKMLNPLGAEGWALVATTDSEMIFKRPLRKR